MSGGGIAVCERYPLFAPFGDDTSPSLNAPAPDLLVHIRTDLEQMLTRRPDDDPETLRAKYAAFTAYAESNPGLMLAAEGTIEQWVGEGEKAVFEILLSRVNQIQEAREATP